MDYKYESEIDLKNLIFFILYKWRTLLLLAIVFCILLGGYGLVNKAVTPSEGNVKTKEEREYELQLMEYELSLATYQQNIADYQKQLDQQETYMEKSVLMQLDPYKKPIASADFFVKINDAEWSVLPDNVNLDPTDSLLKVYTSNFLSSLDWEPIQELTNLDVLYLKELISINTDYNSNTFTVMVVYNDGEMAQKILDIVVGQVCDKYNGMDLNVSKHSISVLNQSLSYIIDKGLADTQKNNADAIAKYRQSILECQKSIEELEEPIEPSGKSVLKFAVLGFLLGGILAALFYGIGYLFGDKFHNEEEIKTRYACRLLGFLPKTHRKVPFEFIDSFLERLEGIKKPITKEKNYEIFAANVKNFSGKYRKILITGTIDTSILQEIAEAVAPYTKNFTMTASANMLLSAETLNLINDYDAIIFVEERHKSLNSDILKEQECVVTMNKPVIGYALL